MEHRVLVETRGFKPMAGMRMLEEDEELKDEMRWFFDSSEPVAVIG